MKINNFRAGLTGISAEKEALIGSLVRSLHAQLAFFGARGELQLLTVLK